MFWIDQRMNERKRFRTNYIKETLLSVLDRDKKRLLDLMNNQPSFYT